MNIAGGHCAVGRAQFLNNYKQHAFASVNR